MLFDAKSVYHPGITESEPGGDTVARDNRAIVEVAAAELRDGDRDGNLGIGRRIVGDPRRIGGGRVELVMQWSNGRRDTARPEAHRTYRVKRLIVGPGLACRHRTDDGVEVFDTGHRDSPVRDYQAGGHRWALRCAHGTVTGRRTLPLAQADADRSEDWCDTCAAAVPALLPL